MRQTIGQSLKELATTLGAVVAVAYGTGYIVTTMHLYWWHIYNPTLVNGRYVSVGFCFLWITATTLLPVYYLAPSWSARIRRHSWRSWNFLIDLIIIFLSVVGLILLSAVLICILSAPPVLNRDALEQMTDTAGLLLTRDMLLDILVGWYGFLLAAGFLLQTVATGRLPRACVIPGAIAERSDSVPHNIWKYGLIVLLLVFATCRYAVSIYPCINPAVGGGQECWVQLIFNTKDSTDIQKLVPMDPSLPISKPVELLEQTDKTYIVLIRDAQTKTHLALEITKNLVNGTLKALRAGPPPDLPAPPRP